MTAYYNEIDPFAAAWLRELIKAGEIAPGEVDERSIEDVCPDDLKAFTQCHFFAGIGVWSYALRRAGWPDDKPVWTGSCPCQPFSQAGERGGFTDERHLWPAQFHLIRELRPDVWLGEQVASKDGLSWLDLVCDDLEATGYAIGAVDTSSALTGAPHVRQRLRIAARRVADADEPGLPRQRGPSPHHVSRERETAERHFATCALAPHARPWADALGADGRFRRLPPGFGAGAHGATARVGQLRGYGNAVDAVATEYFIRAFIETEANLPLDGEQANG